MSFYSKLSLYIFLASYVTAISSAPGAAMLSNAITTQPGTRGNIISVPIVPNKSYTVVATIVGRSHQPNTAGYVVMYTFDSTQVIGVNALGTQGASYGEAPTNRTNASIVGNVFNVMVGDNSFPIDWVANYQVTQSP